MLSTRELLRLAFPSIVFAVLTNGYRAVDQFWIPGVSTEAQAAIGSSIFVLIFFYAAFHLVASGAAPLVARFTGAGDAEGRRVVLGQSIAGAVAIAGLCAVGGGIGAPWISAALGLEGQTAVECTAYLRTLTLTMLPLVLTPLVDQAFISMGSARLPMILHGVSLGLNFVLTPLLIVQADLGVVGAALASNGSRAVTTSIGLVVLWKQTGLERRHVRLGSQLLRVVRIGYPIAATIAVYALVYWALLKTSVSPLGPRVNAALGIGFSALEGFTWPMFHGVQLAVASFVGRALGARQPERAWAALRRAVPLITALGVGAGLAFYFAGETLTGLFTEDPEVHAAATTYAVILAFSQLLVAYETLFDGVFQGAGDTRTIFWLSAPLNALRIPLAWWMAFPLGMGAAGIWWAINITSLLKPAIKLAVLLKGRWATLEI